MRVKESDRIHVMVQGLKKCNVNVTEHPDGMTISHSSVKGNVTIETHLDHRIAMSFLILGLISQKTITIDDASVIETSFPDFVLLLNKLGAKICP